MGASASGAPVRPSMTVSEPAAGEGGEQRPLGPAQPLGQVPHDLRRPRGPPPASTAAAARSSASRRRRTPRPGDGRRGTWPPARRCGASAPPGAQLLLARRRAARRRSPRAGARWRGCRSAARNAPGPRRARPAGPPAAAGRSGAGARRAPAAARPAPRPAGPTTATGPRRARARARPPRRPGGRRARWRRTDTATCPDGVTTDTVPGSPARTARMAPARAPSAGRAEAHGEDRGRPFGDRDHAGHVRSVARGCDRQSVGQCHHPTLNARQNAYVEVAGGAGPRRSWWRACAREGRGHAGGGHGGGGPDRRRPRRAPARPGGRRSRSAPS